MKRGAFMYTSVVNAQAKAEKRVELNAYVQAFINSGLTITVCPTRKVKPRTFGRCGGIGYRGAKANNLIAQGYAKAR
jgi:hypothetical protein